MSSFPLTFICFKMVQTTNQYSIIYHCSPLYYIPWYSIIYHYYQLVGTVNQPEYMDHIWSKWSGGQFHIMTWSNCIAWPSECGANCFPSWCNAAQGIDDPNDSSLKSLKIAGCWCKKKTLYFLPFSSHFTVVGSLCLLLFLLLSPSTSIHFSWANTGHARPRFSGVSRRYQ